MNQNRLRLLQQGNNTIGPVVYWMSRDQRVHDNWGILFAQEQALKKKSHLIVLFALQTEFLGAGLRHYDFMLKGLEEVENTLRGLSIPFYLVTGNASDVVPQFITSISASELIADFDPLRIKRIWKRDVAKQINIPFYEVDAHNIVPCLYVSQKEEFAAYTIRPKIHKLLPEFLDDFAVLKPQSLTTEMPPPVNWEKIRSSLKVDSSVKPVSWITPGEKSAMEMLNNFIENKLHHYAEKRNFPDVDFQSQLSPYLHFGQISAQRIAIEINKRIPADENTKVFLEELIVRRELADNFCYFNKNYDSFEGFQEWAKVSLNEHLSDKRDYIYSYEEFDNAVTHDPLWNAAQNEMKITGKMHGYMRMYWAKKILEWTANPSEAMNYAVKLNDKYELDGRDPNGYTGCAWSIGGVHDRPWFERPVFGKIRYMNYNGCARKFNVDSYITRIRELQ